MTETTNQRSRILEAAQGILRKDGVEALSVRNIAKRAGLSTMGVYSYFGGKDQVCEELYIAGFRDLATAVARARTDEDPEAVVVESTRNYLEFYQHNENRYALMFGMGASDYTPGETAKRAARESFEVAISLVQPLTEYLNTTSEAERLALQIWASTHGFIAIKPHASGIDEGVWQELVIESTRQLIRGQAIG
ncbi:TetR/AcrR family transcriptional regulator [uncultured Erythrobacter sp.]|uniref:TetR/AcrR family transcriptional regulator n=1 Tax=uncultured Erythrobacter sp. TaxID=263913 RepID=UPI00261DBDC8|nr:TetR/AcrR family transcriptional regulator [uncultured Erythrobacter sp.]